MPNETIALLVAVSAGITELAKTVGLPSRLAPLLSLALGIGTVFLSAGSISGGVVITGCVIGLTASGFYSGVKTIAGK